MHTQHTITGQRTASGKVWEWKGGMGTGGRKESRDTERWTTAYDMAFTAEDTHTHRTL